MDKPLIVVGPFVGVNTKISPYFLNEIQKGKVPTAINMSPVSPVGQITSIENYNNILIQNNWESVSYFTYFQTGTPPTSNSITVYRTPQGDTYYQPPNDGPILLGKLGAWNKAVQFNDKMFFDTGWIWYIRIISGVITSYLLPWQLPAPPPYVNLAAGVVTPSVTPATSLVGQYSYAITYVLTTGDPTFYLESSPFYMYDGTTTGCNVTSSAQAPAITYTPATSAVTAAQVLSYVANPVGMLTPFTTIPNYTLNVNVYRWSTLQPVYQFVAQLENMPSMIVGTNTVAFYDTATDVSISSNASLETNDMPPVGLVYQNTSIVNPISTSSYPGTAGPTPGSGGYAPPGLPGGNPPPTVPPHGIPVAPRE